jgi:hypothetical protein
MGLSQRRSFEHDFSSSEAQREYVVERRVIQTRTEISQSAHDSGTKNVPRASSRVSEYRPSGGVHCICHVHLRRRADLV